MINSDLTRGVTSRASECLVSWGGGSVSTYRLFFTSCLIRLRARQAQQLQWAHFLRAQKEIWAPAIPRIPEELSWRNKLGSQLSTAPLTLCQQLSVWPLECASVEQLEADNKPHFSLHAPCVLILSDFFSLVAYVKAQKGRSSPLWYLEERLKVRNSNLDCSFFPRHPRLYSLVVIAT